jgi:hypothetical protein
VSTADYNLERALGEFDDGKRYRDTIGPAIYMVEPQWATAILCTACLYVAIIPRLPRLMTFVHQCSQCGARIRLAPPAEVFSASPPSSVVGSAATSRHGRPST